MLPNLIRYKNFSSCKLLILLRTTKFWDYRESFLEDVIQLTKKQRVVLLIDTYEQMTGVDNWIREMVMRKPANLFVVIAGRAPLNSDWDRYWPGWMAKAYIEELRPMTEDDLRILIRRYYSTMRGDEPVSRQVEEIVDFARG
ncbi:MAG: hypothetical protein ACE5I1_16105, partial [bacterium]